MKKTLVKLSIILLITVLIVMMFANIGSYADTVSKTFTGSSSSKTLGATRNLLGIILNSVRITGLAVSIIILTVIGMKFMMASPSERANIKQYSMNYVIGAGFLFAATGIVSILKAFAKEIKVE